MHISNRQSDWIQAISGIALGRIAHFLALFALVLSLRAEDRLTLVSPHPQEVKAEFGQAFAAWHLERFGTPIAIDWRDLGGTSEIQRFVESEFRAKTNGIGIDVFFGGGPEPFLALADKGFLQPYPGASNQLVGIPARARSTDVYDEQYRWFGAALSSFGILQNRRVQLHLGLPHAERWEDLSRTNCFLWVGAGDPRTSGSMNNMYEAFLQAYGWDRGWQLLTEIAGNVRQFDRLSTSTAKDTALGQVAYSLAIDYFAFIQIASAGKTNLEFTLPRDFTAISPDGIAILKGAPHSISSQRFLEFVLSERGQKLWCLPKGHPEGPKNFSIERLPIRPDFYSRYKEYSAVQTDPFQLDQTYRYDSKLARKRRDIVRSVFGAILVDVHPELQRCWKRLIVAGMPDPERRNFGAPPLSEKEALELASNDRWIKDAEFRSRKRLEWQVGAQSKYRRILSTTEP